jgi:hypothetical protein
MVRIVIQRQPSWFGVTKYVIMGENLEEDNEPSAA